MLTTCTYEMQGLSFDPQRLSSYSLRSLPLRGSCSRSSRIKDGQEMIPRFRNLSEFCRLLRLHVFREMIRMRLQDTNFEDRLHRAPANIHTVFVQAKLAKCDPRRVNLRGRRVARRRRVADEVIAAITPRMRSPLTPTAGILMTNSVAACAAMRAPVTVPDVFAAVHLRGAAGLEESSSTWTNIPPYHQH